MKPLRPIAVTVTTTALLASSFLFAPSAPAHAHIEVQSQEADPLRLCKILQHQPRFCTQAHL